MQRLLWCFVVAALAASGCSIREDPAPRAIGLEDRGRFGEIATGGVAEGGDRIYLLSSIGTDSQTQLRSVARVESSSPLALLRLLRDGANEDENAIGLSSAIPADLEFIDARTVGARLTIDIDDSLSELSDLGLRQALAQIVATAAEIDQVQLVRLRVDGQNQGWPTGNGEVTDEPLSVYDYSGFLETSQPDFTALPA
ncbi:MAG: GerMN domain-containing protein [Ilumatobacter sp.]